MKDFEKKLKAAAKQAEDRAVRLQKVQDFFASLVVEEPKKVKS